MYIICNLLEMKIQIQKWWDFKWPEVLLAPPEVIFANFTAQPQSYILTKTEFVRIKDRGRVSSMLVTDVGDEMGWWQQ